MVKHCFHERLGVIIKEVDHPSTWSTTNKVFDEQMIEVKKHFTDKGYTISRVANTSATTGSHAGATGLVFKWSISWS